MLKVESASEVQSRDAEKGTGWGTRSPTPFAGQRRPTPALPVDAVSIATGGGRAGPESGSRGAASPAPAPAPNPRPGSPACGAGLAPVGVTASFSPLPPVPEPLGPGACQRQLLVLGIRRRGHGWRSRPAQRGRFGGAEVRCLGDRALPAAVPAWTRGSGKLRCQHRRRCCNSGRAAGCRSPRFSSSSSPSSSSRPRRGPLLALLLLLLQPPPPLRYSQACYYAGGNGLLRPSLPRPTPAPGLLVAGPD